jgi:hypothetical protein
MTEPTPMPSWVIAVQIPSLYTDVHADQPSNSEVLKSKS